MRLTIVVPAFNEAKRLPEGIRRFDTAVAEGAVDLSETELILVDDGSADDTTATAAKLLSVLPHHQVVTLPNNRGKGAAVRAGVAVARGRAIAFMDADMAIDPRAVPLLLDGLEEYDMAVGSRALAGSAVETTYAARSLMGHVFNRLVTTGTGLSLRDTQCGFKAFRAPVARLLFQLVSIDRFAFDVELLLRAQRLGLSITEVPVHWKHVADSTVHALPDSLTMLFDVIRSRVRLVTAPQVSAVVVVGRSNDRVDLRARIAGALGGTPNGDKACLIADGGELTILFPLLSTKEVSRLHATLRTELEPINIVRRMITFDDLEAMRPLAERVVFP